MADKKQYELAVKIAGMIDGSLTSSCSLTKKQLKEIAKAAADANRSSVSFQDAMAKAGPGIDAAWGGLKKTAMTTVGAMAAAEAAVLSLGAASTSVGMEFESAMDSWKATASASEEDYAKAREAAMEMGRTTSKTASESAQALEYMALAGWSVEDSIAGLPGILRLSEATGLDLARTSDLVTDSMSALGVEIQDLDGYLDVAAKANNKSNQTAEQLMEAYLGVGGTMKNLRVPVQESAAALGVLANRGIKGSEAGNALNAVLVNLTTGSGQAGKMMDRLKISAFDSQGNFIGLHETLEVLNRSLSGLSEEQRNAAMAAIGGKQHVDALNDLMAGLNTEVAEGVSEWASLEAELKNAGGALEQMADTKLDNLNGDLAVLRSALEDSGIQIYDSLREPLREAVQYGTQMVYGFSDTVTDRLEHTLPTVKRLMGDAGESVEAFAGPMMEAGEFLLDNSDKIAGGLAAVGTTITAMKLAKTISETTAAAKAMGVALAANPVTATLTALAVAGGALAGTAVKIRIANEQMKKQKLENSFGKITLSLEELQDTAEYVIGEDSIRKLASSMEGMEKVAGYADSLEETFATVRQLTWKAGIGMELTETDQADFGSAVDRMVRDSISLVEQAQYTAHLNVNAIFGEGSVQGQEILQGFDAMYANIHEEVSYLGQQLGYAYREAMEDGIIDMDEARTIQELQASLARVTEQVSQAQFGAKLDTLKLKFSGKDLDAETFQNLQAEIQEVIDENMASAQSAHEYNMGALNLRLERSQGGEISITDPEYLTEAAYSEIKQQLEKGFLDKQTEIELNGIRFQTQSICDAFQEDIEAAAPELAENISRMMEEAFRRNPGSPTGALNEILNNAPSEGITLAPDTRMAVEELLEAMKPSVERTEEIAKQYEALGEEPPKALHAALTKVENLEMLTGDIEAVWKYVGTQVSDNPELEAAVNAALEAGGTLPPAVSEGMWEEAARVEAGVDFLFQNTQRYVNQKFSTPITVRPNLDIRYSAPFADGYTPGTGKAAGAVRHARGGIFDTPHWGVFAEEGPEAFIPLDGSSSAVSVWEEAGKHLGILGDPGGSGDPASAGRPAGASEGGGQFVYSPSYNIYGADEETVRRATDDDYGRFERFLRQYERNRQRVSF